MDDDLSTPQPRRRPWYRRRWFVTTVAVLAALVLAVIAGGGWYFSSKIRADAIAVKTQAESTIDLEHVVLGVDEGSIAFALPADPPADLVSGERLGVRWEGGYGTVGRILTLGDDRIEREFSFFASVTERLPEPGDLTAFEGVAYPDDPAVLGYPVAAAVYTSPAGAFDALVVGEGGPTWMIFVHGRGATPREGYRIVGRFAEAGIPSLLIHYRNDDGQPGDDRLADFGATEWEDLEAAVGFTLDRGADRVVLVGYSMGGAIALAFMERSPLADRVAGMILDAPALKLGAMVDARAADTNLPLLPIRVPPPLPATAKLLASWRFGVDWNDIDYLERIGRIEVPLLLFHGTEDDSVPVWLSDSAAAEYGGPVTYVRVDGAGHVRSWNVDPGGYESAVDRFIAGVPR